MLNTDSIKVPINLNIDNSALPQVTFARDLGITVTNNLSPSVHIRDTVSKVHSRALTINHSFVSRDTNLLVRAYKTYVIPLVEHKSVIWSPIAIDDMEEIARVQRKLIFSPTKQTNITILIPVCENIVVKPRTGVHAAFPHPLKVTFTRAPRCQCRR